MINDDIIKIGSTVISKEADALKILSFNMPTDFPEAVKTILNSAGRVIVSGIGKSGHIGKKIAATLASTGTPAQFVHATEASHGDLGMLQASDFCLLISNSGETAELRDIISHSRRFNIPMAAISSSADSALVRASDYKLLLPNLPEACVIGMAPTTSTTLALALGDALAIALMERRKFRTEDFKTVHPGGKLGAQMTTVSQLMRPRSEMSILSVESTMQQVVLSMTKSGYGIAVLENSDGSILGVISDGDLRRNINNLLDKDPISIITKDPISIGPDELVEVAIKKMQTEKVYSLLVSNANVPVGLLRMHDLMHNGIV